MSDISYCDRTLELVAGCTRCSPGCEHCWAVSASRRKAGMANRMIRDGRDPGWLKHYDRVLTPDTPRTWNGRVEVMPENLGLPLRWRKPQTIFVCSQGDLFHDKVTFRFINGVFGVMAHCPQHTFLVLTKRPDRMLAWAQEVALMWRQSEPEACFCSREAWREARLILGPTSTNIPWPLPNVWLGATVEDQERLDERIEPMLELVTRGWHTWLSVEPLLGPLDLDASIWPLDCGDSIEGIVVGGEAGPGSRPMHPDCPRRIRDDCAAAGVPFYFKQWGDWRYNAVVEREKQHIWSDGTISGRVGKKAAGRLLDGVEHNALPWGPPEPGEALWEGKPFALNDAQEREVARMRAAESDEPTGRIVGGETI